MSTPTANQVTAPATGITRAALLQKLSGYGNTQLIYVVAHLGIADLLVNGPQSSAALAAELGLAYGPLQRLLRGCVGNGLLSEVEGGCFAATPLLQLLESARPDSLRDYAILTGELWYPAWGSLLAALQTGELPFVRVFGTDYYSYLTEKPAVGRRFHGFMQARTVQTIQALTTFFDFSAFTVVVDIGGGNGTLLQTVLTVNPHLQGILYDLPAVVAEAEQCPALQQLAGRYLAIGGDFLQQVPAGGDCYILSQILHNWGDDQCRQILRNCNAVMPQGSRLLIIEQLISEPLQGNAPAIESDLMMLVFLGGQERTGAAYEKLLHSSGFTLIAIHPLKCLGYSLIEAQPQPEERNLHGNTTNHFNSVTSNGRTILSPALSGGG